MTRPMLLLFAVLGGSAGCTAPEGTTGAGVLPLVDSTALTPPRPREVPVPKVLLHEAWEPDARLTGAHEILDARIDGHRMWLRVRAHTADSASFSLIVSPSFAESSPVQTGAVLAHPTDQTTRPTVHLLQFDLMPLREAYRRAYRTTAGRAILIHIDRGSRRRRTLRYQL